MALGSTIYNFEISLSDTTREIYESLALRVAQHPSENAEFLVCRVLAYCLEYTERLEFSKGLEDPDMPAIWAHDLTGQLTHWIEIGAPSAEKLHKASKSVGYVRIYTHKYPAASLEILKGQKIHRADQITLNAFPPAFIDQIVGYLERRNVCELMRSEGAIYLNINGNNISTNLESYVLS